MADANEDLFDAAIRHQIGIRRFAAGEIREMLAILSKSDRELLALIQKSGVNDSFATKRLRALYKDIRELRTVAMNEMRKELRKDLVELAKAEQVFETRMFTAAIPVQIDYAVASAAQLRALVSVEPFSGGTNNARNLNQWFVSLRAADQARIVGAIQQGIILGEGTDQITRRIRGTRANQFSDGVLLTTRRNAEAITRTAVNHVSNASRELFWEENAEVIDYLRWNAVLDGRTSAICQARDGHNAPLTGSDTTDVPSPKLSPATARPPAHPNCRSVMTAVLDAPGVANVIGERPFVRDARTRRQRQIDFRADAKERVGAAQWKKLSTGQRNALVRTERNAWADANIGTVPADVTYDQWLRRQSTTFQNEVLGPSRGKAFRKGLNVDKFVDRQGNELTLDELKETQPEFF